MLCWLLWILSTFVFVSSIPDQYDHHRVVYALKLCQDALRRDSNWKVKTHLHRHHLLALEQQPISQNNSLFISWGGR